MAEYEIGDFKYKSNRDLTGVELDRLTTRVIDAGLTDPKGESDSLFTTEDLLNDTTLHDAYRIYHKRRTGEDFDGDVVDLVQSYKGHMRDYENNLFYLTTLATSLNDYTEQEKQAFAILVNKWESVAPFYAEGGDSWRGFADVAGSAIFDWANVINIGSIGAGAVAGVAARSVAKHKVKDLVKRYTTSGLLQGVINGSVFGGLDADMRQNVKKQIGMIDEKSFARTLLSAGGGAVIGGALGGFVGAGIPAMKKGYESLSTKISTGKTSEAKKQKLTDEALEAARKYIGQQFITNTKLQKFAQESGPDFAKRKAKARQDARNQFVNDLSTEYKEQLEAYGYSFSGLKDNISKEFDNAEKIINKYEIDPNDLSTVTKMQETLIKKGTPADEQGITSHIFNYGMTQAWLEIQQASRNGYRGVDAKRLEDIFMDFTLLSRERGSLAGRSLADVKKGYKIFDDANFESRADWFEHLGNLNTLQDAVTYTLKSESLINKYGKFGRDAVQELFIHNILGSVKTLTINFFGAGLHGIDRYLSKGIYSLVSGDKAMQKQVFYETVNLGQNIAAATKEAMSSVNDSKTRIDTRWIKESMEDGIETADNVTIGKELPLFAEKNMFNSGLTNFLGNSMRFLGRRGILGTDEFIKQLAFRNKAMSLAMEEIVKVEGKDLSKISFKELSKLKTKIADRAQKAVDSQLDSVASRGLESLDPIAKLAIKEARVTAFQDNPDLYTGGALAGFDPVLGASAGLQALKRKERQYSGGFLEFLVPFVRTPGNLISYTTERTPLLQLFSDKFGKKIQQGGAHAKEAHAHLNAGVMLWATALYFGTNNMIEGAGPREDKGRQRVRERTLGIQRHSVLINKETGKRVNYRKADPYARFLYLTGNMLDVYKYGSKQATEELFGQLALATAGSLLEMPTLTGLKQIAGLISDPDYSIPRLAGTLTGSLIPYFRTWHDITKDDDVYKEMRDFTEYATSKLYGVNNELLDRQRDPIFGMAREYAADFPYFLAPLETVTERDIKNPLMIELKRIKFSHTNPAKAPARYGNQVDLTRYKLSSFRADGNDRSLYDEYQRLVGNIKIYGETLEEKLTKVVQSDFYLRKSDPIRGEGNNFSGGKTEVIKNIISEYRSAALDEIETKYPTFMDEVGYGAIVKNRIDNEVSYESVEDFLNSFTN